MIQDKDLAPVVLFVYQSLETTKMVVESLKANPESQFCDLFIYSDGPKEGSDNKKIDEVRSYVKTISGFASIEIIERPTNQGLAESFILGISEILSRYESAIFLEDDNLLSPYFLKSMNRALRFYANDERVICVSGYSYPQFPRAHRPYFLLGAETWSMGTWRRGWSLFETDSRVLLDAVDRLNLHSQLDMYGFKFYKMLQDQDRGDIDSWGVRWWASAVCGNKLCLYPAEPHCINIGFGSDATHNKTFDPMMRLTTDLAREDVNTLPITAKISRRNTFAIRNGRFFCFPGWGFRVLLGKVMRAVGFKAHSI